MARNQGGRHDLAPVVGGAVVLSGCTGGPRLRLPPGPEQAPGYRAAFRLGHRDGEWVTAAPNRLFSAGQTVRLQLPITRHFGPLPAGSQGRLTLRLWAADPTSRAPGPSHQAHRLRLNGHDLPQTVCSVAGAWSIYSVEVPVAWLRLPAAPPPGGRPEPAANDLELRVQGAGGDGRGGVLLDWARLELDGPRPWVLAHGFLADHTSWQYWQRWAADAGVPTWAFDFADNHGSMWDHAVELRDQIAKAKAYFGVESVNLAGSSKGTVDGRAYLALQTPDVERAVWLAGPHGGSELADIAKLAEGLPGGSLVSRLAEPALTGCGQVHGQSRAPRQPGPAQSSAGASSQASRSPKEWMSRR